jgi:hypothetical protein
VSPANGVWQTIQRDRFVEHPLHTEAATDESGAGASSARSKILIG